MDALLDLISATPGSRFIESRSAGPKAELFSGRIVGVRSETLSKFASDLEDVIFDADFEDIEQLRNLAIIDPDRRYSADWQDVTPKVIVKIIAEASRGSGRQRVKAFA